MRFEIKAGSQPNVKSGTSTKTGQAYSIREQEAWLSLNGELRRVNVRLGREQAAYPPGSYVLDESSFTVGKYGDLAIGRVVLKPAQAAVAGKAA